MTQEHLKNSSYELIDSGNFYKLEQVGPYRLARPSPQAVWPKSLGKTEWDTADATFVRQSSGDGRWEFRKKPLEKQWHVTIGPITFVVGLTDFGHIGIFPEQEKNWQTLREIISKAKAHVKEFKVLNLFAYTGGSTLHAASAGAHLVHLDASKTSVAWARENALASKLDKIPIRWIIDDVQEFVAREVRRGSKYHGIILDPPSYGRGSKNEIWKIEDHLPKLLENIKSLLAEDFVFILLSAHSSGFTPLALQNLLQRICPKKAGRFLSEEMVIESKNTCALPSGASSFYIRD